MHAGGVAAARTQGGIEKCWRSHGVSGAVWGGVASGCRVQRVSLRGPVDAPRLRPEGPLGGRAGVSALVQQQRGCGALCRAGQAARVCRRPGVGVHGMMSLG